MADAGEGSGEKCLKNQIWIDSGELSNRIS